MRRWHFYSLTDGILLSGTFSTNDKNAEEMLGLNTPKGSAPIEGYFDRFTQRVDLETLTVVPYEAKPPADIEREQKDAAARAAIVAIEGDQARVVREALIELLPDGSEAKRKLVQIDSAIATQRADLIGTVLDSTGSPADAGSGLSVGTP